jgi:hypothetical protein
VEEVVREANQRLSLFGDECMHGLKPIEEAPPSHLRYFFRQLAESLIALPKRLQRGRSFGSTSRTMNAAGNFTGIPVMKGQFGRDEGRIATEPGVQQRWYRLENGWSLADWSTILSVHITCCPAVPTRTAGHVSTQCWMNTYDCRDFTTRFEVQAVYWACGGGQNDVHRLHRDGHGWGLRAIP